MDRADDKQLTDWARGIATMQILVANVEDDAWKSSLALIISGLKDYDFSDVGHILVPVHDHEGLHWINGKAPGVTVRCFFVHKEDLPILQEKAKAMIEALYPDYPAGTLPIDE